MRRRPCNHLKKVHKKYGSAIVRVNPDIPKRQRDVIIKGYNAGLMKDLKRKGKVRVNNFGTFRVKKVKARRARRGMNPFTKQMQTFKAKPASRKIKFFPAKNLKEEIK